MARLKPLPAIWLLTDRRNDAVLETVLRRLPRGSALLFRHYHLPGPERRTRFAVLARIARARGHLVVLAGSPAQARRWGADAAYGQDGDVIPAHSLRELRGHPRAQAVLLSPVHPTRTHPGGSTLGTVLFRLLAAHSRVPVIALGGMDARRARALKWPHWAGIDAFLR